MTSTKEHFGDDVKVMESEKDNRYIVMKYQCQVMKGEYEIKMSKIEQKGRTRNKGS